MTTKITKRTPVFNLLENWECPIDWDEELEKEETLVKMKTEQLFTLMHVYVEFMNDVYCRKVKATAQMALDWIFDEKNFGVSCMFTKRRKSGAHDLPLSIIVEIGIDNGYTKLIPLDEMIAQEVDGHLIGRISETKDKTDSRKILDEIQTMLNYYHTQDDWSYDTFLKAKEND